MIVLSCSFLWGGRIVNVAVVGIILSVSYHAVSLGPLGMHVSFFSGCGRTLLLVGVVAFCVNLRGSGAKRYTTVGSGKRGSSTSIGHRRLPILAQPGAIGHFFAPSVFPPWSSGVFR